MKRSQALGDQSNTKKEEFMEALSPPQGGSKSGNRLIPAGPSKKAGCCNFVQWLGKPKTEDVKASKEGPETKGT